MTSPLDQKAEKAELLLERGKQLKAEQNWENALLNFRESTKIFLNLAKNLKEKEDKLEFSKKAKESSQLGLEVKNIINSLTKQLKESAIKNPGQKIKSTIILNQDSFEFYKSIALSYLDIGIKSPSLKFICFHASKAANLIAADILGRLMKLVITKDVQNKLLNEFSIIEKSILKINELIKSEPQIISPFEISSEYEKFNQWKESNAITNIYDEYMFQDSEAKLSFPTKGSFSWKRATDKIFNIELMNTGIQPLISSINGIEVIRNAHGDPVLLCAISSCANLEYCSNKKLLSLQIYPQNVNGIPIYNPCGKYLIKLFISGCWRMVIIDDEIPCNGSAPITISSSKKSIWPSLFEKSIMKVHNGYNISFKHPSSLVYMLTSWIPEKLNVKIIQKEYLWSMLQKGINDNCMIFIAKTARLPEDHLKGLIPEKYYSILYSYQDENCQALLLKSPFLNKNWTGNLSATDALNWTEKLKQNLNYIEITKPNSGRFWIDFGSFINLFSTIEFNISPTCFPYSKTISDAWHSSLFNKDGFSLANNPQFLLVFSPNPNIQTIKCKIVLSRIGENEIEYDDYITINCFISSNNNLIICNEESLLKGGYSNVDPYTINFEADMNEYIKKYQESKYFVLVLSQYLRKYDFYYCIAIHSNTEILNFQKISRNYKYSYNKTLLINECNSSKTFLQNSPQFSVRIGKSNSQGSSIRAHIKGDNKANVSLILQQNFSKNLVVDFHPIFHSEEDVIETVISPNNFYNLVICCDEYKDYSLSILSNEILEIDSLIPKFENLKLHSMKGNFLIQAGIIGSQLYHTNFSLEVEIKNTTTMVIVLKIFQSEITSSNSIEKQTAKYNASMYKFNKVNSQNGKNSLDLSFLKVHPILSTFGGIYTNSPSNLVTESKTIEKGNYLIFVSTDSFQINDNFEILIYSAKESDVLISKSNYFSNSIQK